MDLYTLALSIAYSNKIGKQIKDQAFKTQIESNRDILNTTGEEKIFYFLPKQVGKPQNGYDEYIFFNNNWELMGGTDIDLSGYMTLAPLNPTAEQIAALHSGQLYGDTVNHKGVIKGGQEFYDTNYINNNYYNKTSVDNKLIKVTYNKNGGGPSTSNTNFKRGDVWIDEAGDIWMVSWVSSNIINWEKITRKVTGGMSNPPTTRSITAGTYPPYEQGDLYFKYGSSWNEIDTIFVLLNYSTSGTTCSLKWFDLKSLVDLTNYYTKNEIDQKGYLTLETLPIYDGTVI